MGPGLFQYLTLDDYITFVLILTFIYSIGPLKMKTMDGGWNLFSLLCRIGRGGNCAFIEPFTKYWKIPLLESNAQRAKYNGLTCENVHEQQ